ARFIDFVLVLFYNVRLFLFKRFFMNARMKRVTTAQAHEAVDGDSDLIVVGVVKTPIWRDGKVEGWIRYIIVNRKNKDLPRQPEAAAAPGAIDEGIMSGHDQTY